ncbi:hypothetical protein DFP72DRAFT_1051248 [Ephemerocybe angulata]|uniref:Uncharacterized protein n=1 Tax=Ephemerocybe angulata TaxID=980116 RepID=A0A8H6HGZ8_9AGAR|nr:hypothetical protein DFP72DRAFT_1051248 [Tulosesus angulatus]
MATTRSPSGGGMSNLLSFQLPDLVALTSAFPFRVNGNCKFATDGSEGWFLGNPNTNTNLTSSSRPVPIPTPVEKEKVVTAMDGQPPLLDEEERATLHGAKYGLLASLCAPGADGAPLRILADWVGVVGVGHVRILRGKGHGWVGVGSGMENGDVSWVERAEDGLEVLEGNVLLRSVVPRLRRLRDRLPQAQRAQWNRRFTHSVKAFAKVQLTLYENLKGGVVPTLPEYIQLRREMYGSSMFVDLLDFLEITEMPRGISGREREVLGEITFWASHVVAWVLDIFSYASGTTGATRCNSHNLISLLTTHKNLSVQGAMNYAGGMVKEALEEIQRLERELLPLLSSTNGSAEAGWGAGWISSLRSVVGLADGMAPRGAGWKFLVDVPLDDLDRGISSWYLEGEDDVGAARSLEEAKRKGELEVAKYVRAMKDWIMGSIHWGYETEVYFGVKGDEVRSFGWVFLVRNDETEGRA